MISGLIPFFLESAEIGRESEKCENSLLRTCILTPTASNHFVNLSGRHTRPFSVLKSEKRFIPFSVWPKQFSELKILKCYENPVKGQNYDEIISDYA